ncbi:hypothetical protein E2C01_065011 [Portunus trituberculatus]|uniref:Uncharacterized protein n=1 Tax=Portunus trituberculatus TaxID=210409 RepID=A0A5B7HQK6_PORTR|nr:hypothetical protein [Portunus trituberculatus]
MARWGEDGAEVRPDKGRQAALSPRLVQSTSRNREILSLPPHIHSITSCTVTHHFTTTTSGKDE